MKTMYYVIGGIILLLVLWAIGSHMAVSNLEAPSYTVLENRNSYEIRQYDSYIVAETTVTAADSRQGLNQGFSLVADYIFGNNTAQEKISMTTPVLEEQGDRSEKIAMTVPVLEEANDNATRTIAFVLPSKYTMETLPTPNNDRVTLREVLSKKVAVIRFTWYATPARVEEKKTELLEMLQRDGATPIAEPQVAFYNPPLSFPLTLRNEILIEVE